MVRVRSGAHDEVMINKQNRFAVVGLGGLAAIAATACNIELGIGEEGSGVAMTTSYDLADFDEIDISSAFSAEITVVDGPPSVEVTLDDNLFDDIVVKVDDDELEVKFKSGNFDLEVPPTVVISLPELTELEVSGASEAVVVGLDESELKVEVSGASAVDLDGTAQRLIVDNSGASSLIVTGRFTDVDLDVSGAGNADFSSAEVSTAKVDLSGSSNAEFDEIGSVDGELSGASNLDVPNGISVDVDSSGASEINRR